MITCPNKSLQDWKDLVSAVGENRAYFLWNEYEGSVPKSEYDSFESLSESETIDIIEPTIDYGMGEFTPTQQRVDRVKDAFPELDVIMNVPFEEYVSTARQVGLTDEQIIERIQKCHK